MSFMPALRVRLGACCLLAAALAELLGLLWRGPLTSPGFAPVFFQQVSSSPTLHLGWGLLLPGEMLQCFGWLGVYCWRRDAAEEPVAFWATILSITAIIVFLPVWGALGLTSHEAALAESAGWHGAVALVAATAEGPFARKFLIVSVLSGLLAVALWSRALWRVPKLGVWVVPLLILHAMTQSVTAAMFQPWGYRLERLGALGFVFATAALTVRIWRDSQQSGRAGAGARSR
jgi:type IV secretory pathway VirB2 component (pilin)